MLSTFFSEFIVQKKNKKQNEKHIHDMSRAVTQPNRRQVALKAV